MKKIICFALAMSMIFYLAACRPTPDKAAVAGKNGELEKLIMQPAVSGSPVLDTLPDRWKKETIFESDVALVIDAVIEIPDAGVYPVTEAKPHAFTQEEAKGYVGILMRGQPVFEISPVRIKSDWDEEILQVEAEAERVKNDGSITETERKRTLNDLNGELEYLKELYNNATEKKPDPVPASMTFERQGDSLKVLGVEADLGQARPAILDIHVSDDNLGNGVMFYDGSEDIYTVELQAYTAEGMALSEQEALQKAEEFLKDLGVTDMQLAYTEICADARSFSGSDFSVLASDPEIKKCYVFNFCPVVSGIPVTVNRYFYGDSNSSERYDKVWHDETMLVYVNDIGVYRMDWYGPDDPGEVLNGNVALLDFTEIQYIFEKQMFYQRTWTFPGMKNTTIRIEKVKLGMMRVRLRENKYIYLPVWDFIGDLTYVSDGVEGGMYNVSFLTLNAIDGSVIDRGVGY